MYNKLSKLIEKKFYINADIATSKCDICFAMGKITQDEYTNLMVLINDKYPEATKAE